MATPTVKEILIKWGVDISSWKTALTTLSKLVDDQNKKSAQASADAAKTFQAQADSANELVAATKKTLEVLSKLQEQVEDRLRTEQLITAELTKQADILRGQMSGARAPRATTYTSAPSTPTGPSATPRGAQPAAEYAKSIAELKAAKAAGVVSVAQETAERAKIVALLDVELQKLRAKGVATNQEVAQLEKLARLKVSYQQPPRPPKPPGGEGGIFGGFWEKMRGGAGSIMFPKELTGVVALGSIAAKGLEVAAEAAVHFAEEIKKLILESDQFANVWKTFNTMASAVGQEPEAMMSQLEAATHGLIDNTRLASEAIRQMGQNTGLTQADIIHLTGSVADLARATGRDATAAMEALNRGLSTGRLNMVAYQLGLETTVRSQLALTHAIPESMRALAEFNIIQSAVEKQLAKTGPPIETLGTAFERLGHSWDDFVQRLVLAVLDTPGAKALEGTINEINSLLRDNKPFLEGMASIIGDLLGLLDDFVHVLLEVSNALKAIWNNAEGVAKGLGDTEGIVGGIRETIRDLSGALLLLKLYIEQLAAAAKRDADEKIALLHGSIKEYFDAQIQYYWSLLGAANEYYDEVDKRQKKLAIERAGGADAVSWAKGLVKPPPKVLSPEEAAAAADVEKIQADLEDHEFKIRMQKQLTEVQKLEGEKRLLEVKHETDTEKTLYSQLYQFGAVSFKKFIEAQKSERIKETQVEVENLEKQKKAQQSLFAEENKINLLAIAQQKVKVAQAGGAGTEQGKKAYAEQLKFQEIARQENVGAEKIRLEFDNKILASKQKLAKDLLNLAFEENKDELEAYRTTITEIEKLGKDAIEIRKESLENSFKLAEVSAADYLSQRAQLVKDEYDIEVKAANEAFTVTEKNEKDIAQLNARLADAAAKQEKELTELYLHEWDIRAKAAEQAYSRVQQVFEGQVKYAESLREGDPLAGLGMQQTALQSLLALEKQRLDFLEKQLATTKSGTTQWFETVGEIQKAQQELVRYNIELIKAQDYVSVIAKDLKNASQVVAMFPKGGRSAEALGRSAGFMEQAQQFWNQFRTRISTQAAEKAGTLKKPITPEEVFASLQKVSNTTADNLKDLAAGAASMKTGMQGLVESAHDIFAQKIPQQIEETIKALQKLDGAIDQFIDNLTGMGKPFSAVPEAAPKPFSTVPAGSFKGLSGPASLGPRATVTESDMQAMDVAQRGAPVSGATMPDVSGSLGTIAAPAEAVGSTLDTVRKNLHTFGDSFLGNNGLIGAMKNFGKNTGEANKDFGNFMSGLNAVASSVGGIMQTFKTVGAGAGAIQGATSFGQLGSAVAGPLGGIIGAAAGAIVGAISGAALEATQKLADRMSAAFKAVIIEVQSGTQTLTSGIQLQIGNIQNAVTQLSGRKGGRDQLKKILPDMESQLQQLQSQQRQVLQTMDQTLNVLNAPEAYQQQLTSIDSIIQKYTQYIQAGGSVVNANQFLQDSFKQLAVQGIATLNQDEQDAINNALQYNDLLLQRQNLIQDTNQQIQDIMSQGVAVRQMPAGVTKARQIQQLMRGAAQQMDTLNQEIAVSQHKLENEQKIFNLATTRVGLESQLVTLQNEQTDLSMQQIMALGNVVSALQQKLPTSVPAALQQLGLGATYVSPSTEPGMQPVPPVKTGIADIDLENQAIYQQQLAAWQLAQNIPIGYISPTGTVTTTPVPTTIGTPTSYSGAPLSGASATWLTPGWTPTSMAGTGAAAATSLIGATQAIGQLGASVSAALGFTVNNEPIQTVSTTQGTALLVAAGDGTLQMVPIPTGPGTTQSVGLIGTAQQVAAATTSTFNALTGAPPAGGTPAPPVPTGFAAVDLRNKAIYQQKLSVAKTIWGTPAPASTLTTAPTDTTKIGTTSMSAPVAAAVADNRLAVETTINNLSTTRISAETQLVNLKMQEIQADMQRINAWQSLLASAKVAAPASATLEEQLQNVYETRGRQGFGGFYGETANPL
jgi:hypothetical protein